MLRNEEWWQEDSLMLKKGRVYIPKDEKLRVKVIRLHHDTPIGGHCNDKQVKTTVLSHL